MIKARSGEYWVIRFQDGENLLEGLKGLGLKSVSLPFTGFQRYFLTG